MAATGKIEPPRDLLEDLDEVLGDESVPAADVPALLSRFAPKWCPYRDELVSNFGPEPALTCELAELAARGSCDVTDTDGSSGCRPVIGVAFGAQ
jgi:hypothetical protein